MLGSVVCLHGMRRWGRIARRAANRGRGRLFVMHVARYAFLVMGVCAGCGATSQDSLRRQTAGDNVTNERSLVVHCAAAGDVEFASRRAVLIAKGKKLPLRLYTEGALHAQATALSALLSREGAAECAGDTPILVHSSGEEGVADGALQLRSTAREPRLLVHAPHVHFDVDTMAIGAALLGESNVRGLLFNTAHRYSAAQCDYEEARPPACPSDVVHGLRGFFDVADAALAAAFPGDVTVAVHGFKKRSGEPDIIVSAAGTSAPIDALATALATAVPGYSVARFPDEVDRLGGTTGHQARRRRLEGRAFWHLELSRQLRKHLRDDPLALNAFARAVAGALPDATSRESGTQP